MRSTHQRRALAFALFCRLLPKLSPLQASHLCSQTVLYSISVHTSSPDSHLHNSARMMIKTILIVAEKSMAMRSALVSSILTNEPFLTKNADEKKKKKQRKSHGSQSGPVAKLLKGLDSAAFLDYVNFLKSQISLSPGESNEAGKSRG